MFICHKKYDTTIDVESSNRENFKIKIPERIAPGNSEVLDCVQTNIDENGFGDKMVIITRRDANFFYHCIYP